MSSGYGWSMISCHHQNHLDELGGVSWQPETRGFEHENCKAGLIITSSSEQACFNTVFKNILRYFFTHAQFLFQLCSLTTRSYKTYNATNNNIYVSIATDTSWPWLRCFCVVYTQKIRAYKLVLIHVGELNFRC